MTVISNRYNGKYDLEYLRRVILISCAAYAKVKLTEASIFWDAPFEAGFGQISPCCVRENLVRLKKFIGKLRYPGKTESRVTG